MSNSPFHVAIIPDGNRRWAKRRGQPAMFGHMAGAKAFQTIARAALEENIECLTIWGGSYDNLTKRKKLETKGLFEIYDKHFKDLLSSEEIHKKKVCVRVLGRYQELLYKKTLKTIDQLEKISKSYKKHNLTFLIGYNGTDEMIDCIKKITKKNLRVSPKTIKENLWTRELPPVDLIIRTGEEGDPHNSAGFMMWDTAYSQYYFTKTCWPAFTPKEFRKAVDGFSKRERRLGK